MEKEEKMILGICDDEELICKELVSVIYKVLEEQRITGEVEYFTSGRDLLKEIDRFGLVFLDMDMPDMDGMEVGREIEAENPECKIVVASSREDRFKETYRIHPLRFISKPFDEEEVKDAIKAYTENLIGYAEIEMYRNRKSYWFRQRDIHYIASFRGYVEMMVDGCVYRKDISLKQLEEILDEEMFFKVHKSYIVNLLWVKEIKADEVFVGKIKIPLSRRQRKEFEDAYIRFDLKYR
ncbi:MAG: LytTR family DNA-binding domain-containing protein [Clostridiales bacterium]|nr:LytTR family DNA-binding domain-containing protein [Clostridiales bacterium]